MATNKRTLYEILGVERDATALDIGLAFERRSAEIAGGLNPDPNELALVRQAQEVLANPARRAVYDVSLVTAEEKAAAASQEAPDLLLEPEAPAGPSRRKIGLAIAGVVAVALALYLALAPKEAPKPPPVAEAPAPAPPPPPPPPQPKSAADILAAASSSVGIVQSYTMSGQAVPAGLALTVERGAMITTCHGLPAGAQIVVRVKDKSHSAQVSAADEELNLCRLSIPDPGTALLSVSPDEPKAGDRIFALGANARGELALTEGTIKQVRPVPVATGKVFEISMPVAPAGTGGAVFDTYGRLAGIAVTPHDYGVNLAIAVPSTWIAELRARTKTPR